MKYSYLSTIIQSLPEGFRRRIIKEIRAASVKVVKTAIKRGRILGNIEYSLFDGHVDAMVLVKSEGGVSVVKSKGWPDISVSYIAVGIGHIQMFEIQLLKEMYNRGMHLVINGVCLPCSIGCRLRAPCGDGVHCSGRCIG